MNKKIINALNDIDDEYISKAHKRFNFKGLVTWANFGKLSLCGLSLLLVVSLSSNLLGSKLSDEATSSEEETYYSLKNSPQYNDGLSYASEDYNIQENDAKLIINASAYIETSNYEETIENINNNLKEVNGYAKSTSAYTTNDDNRYWQATLRIPSEKYDSFIEELKTNNNVAYYNESIDDITETYNDLEARLTALKAQENKVIEFYNQAQDIDDLMSIESRLSDLRYEIEAIETQIKNYDTLTSYATIDIEVQESITYNHNKKLSERLKDSFINGFNNFKAVIENIILFISYHIFLISLLIIILVIILIIKRKKQK